MKQYQEYQNLIDNLEDSPTAPSTGKIEGKTVKKLSNDDTIKKIFKNSVDESPRK